MFDFIAENTHEDHLDRRHLLKCLYCEEFLCAECAELHFVEARAACAKGLGLEMTMRTAILAALEVTVLFA